MPAPLLIVAPAFALVAAAFLLAAVSAFRDRRLVASGGRFLVGGLLLALAALAATISVAVKGYRALTHEELAARVQLLPTAPHRFRATVTIAGVGARTFDLAGDEVYVDAHILKWHPWVNVLGLHTAYRLDRIGGRYHELADERTKPRTLEPLVAQRPLDMFALARRHRFFGLLVDAQYGSAAFIPAGEAASCEVRVSTTGLLWRKVVASTRP